MKKIVLFSISCFLIHSLFAQDSTFTKKKDPANLFGQAGDHLIIQLGYTAWAGKPDSIHTTGFSKSINVYLMFAFPFKNEPRLSFAAGGGISSDHIQFKDTYVGITDQTERIQFSDESGGDHFKRTKLVTTYFEAPFELRYTMDPSKGDKSIKFAVGGRVGYMLNAHTRSKDLEDSDGNEVNSFSVKESSKDFFNATRVVATVRAGKGHFSLYGSFQATPLFKDGVAAQIWPFSIGLSVSGL